MIDDPQNFEPIGDSIINGVLWFLACAGFAMFCAWLYSTTPGPVVCDATAATVVCK
jgi:hypothetical protein